VSATAACVLLAVGAWAAPVLAEPPDAGRAEPPRVAGPRPATDTPAPHESAAPDAPHRTVLLTRARVRARIESIDPAGWLAHYGPVERSATDRR